MALEPFCQNSRPASCGVMKKKDCASSFFTFLSSSHKSNFCNGVLISCSTHLINKLFPFTKNHHVIHQSRWYYHSTWVTLDRTNISQFPIFLFYAFRTLVLMLPHEKSNGASPGPWTFSGWFRNFHFKTESTPSQCLAPFVSRSSWSWCPTMFVTHLEMRGSNEPLANAALHGDLFLPVYGFFAFRCSDVWLLLPPLPLLLLEEAGATRIAEATVSRCMLEGRTFVLTLFETCECCSWLTTASFWRFETHIMEVAFLRAYRRTVVHDLRDATMNFMHKSWVTTTYQNPYGVSWWTQSWYLHFNSKNIKKCRSQYLWLDLFFLWALYSLHTDVRFPNPSSFTVVVTS